jgi:hypothetical protein
MIKNGIMREVKLKEEHDEKAEKKMEEMKTKNKV